MRSNARSTVARRLAVTIAEAVPAVAELVEDDVHPLADGDRVVQRLVVRAVDAHELVDARRVERVHLSLETRARRPRRAAASSVYSPPSTVSAAWRIDARMIAPVSTTVPSRSNRTTG